MARGTIIAVLLAAAASPTSVWASRQTEDVRLRTELMRPAPRANPEPGALAESKGKARRNGNVLISRTHRAGDIRLRSHDKACTDENAPGPCVWYRLVADLPSRHAYVVEQGLYEDGHTLLIDDRTGRRTILPGTPLFSPDSQELIAAACNIQSVCDHDLEIWKRSGDRFVFEWGHDPVDLQELASIDMERWDEPDRVTVDFSTLGYFPPPGHWQAVITRQGGQWRLDANIPPHLLAPPEPKGK
jgi:hypothetical protein